MAEQHPITPPPELVQQWCRNWTHAHGEFGVYLATQAARWGADQELEECEKYWMTHGISPEGVVRMREHRRPKPPSLAEAALEVVTSLRAGKCVHRNGGRMNVLTAALKRLQELEEEVDNGKV